ncbi:MAG: ATP-binding cassette domain-containing protein [Bergeyella sp.]|nr:ATP-binding cassette domain-containing protein [Bergeyella sp.]
MSLEIINFSKKYGSQTVLDRINISIKKMEIIGLLGPNGAGKSTLMKSVVGILKTEKGKIFLEGEDISTHPISSKKKIGFLAENNPLYEEMYVREYLDYVTSLHGTDKNRIHIVIDQVGLSEEKNKKIKELSKGYKQRLGIAQAIIHEPNVLILDEPTTGLDPNQIIEIRSLIKKTGEEKIVILSTHLMQEVEAVCSRVILIDKGKMISDAPVENLKKEFGSLETAFHHFTTS